MAWVFVRLKTRLVLNGLRGQRSRIILLIIGALCGLWFGAIGFILLATTAGDSASGPTVAILLGTALTLAWVTFPLLGFGSDASLDPIRLSLLPLSRRQLMAGLLAAACAGIGAIVTAIALLGAVVGFAPAGPGAALVVVAAVGQLLLCLSASNSVLAWLSSALRSRRGRDVRVILVALLVLVPQSLRFVAVRHRRYKLSDLHGVANVAGWLPTALPMRAMVAAARGHLLTSAAELAVSAIVIVGLVRWWAASLDRIMTTAEASAVGPTHRRITSGDPLFGTAFTWLPRVRFGAVAARELRTTWRDPRRRVQLVTGALLPLVVMASFLSRGTAHRAGVIYAALLVIALPGGARSANQIGFDGSAWWLHEACGADLASDLRGKNLALALTTVPTAVVAACVLAALTSAWSELLPVMLMAIGLEGVQLGIGNVLSVRAPWQVPQSASNMWGTSSGQGCLVGLLGLAGLAVQGLLALPFIVAVVAQHTATAHLVAGLVAVPYGYAIWSRASGWAVRAGTERGPEILAAVSAGHAGVPASGGRVEGSLVQAAKAGVWVPPQTNWPPSSGSRPGRLVVGAAAAVAVVLALSLGVITVLGPKRSARTVAFDGLNLRLEPKWYAARHSSTEDFAAVGPGNAYFAVSHQTTPPNATFDYASIAVALETRAIALPGTDSYDPSSVRTVELPIGWAVRFNAVVGSQTHLFTLFEYEGHVIELDLAANGHASAIQDFERMIGSLSLDPPRR